MTLISRSVSGIILTFSRCPIYNITSVQCSCDYKIYYLQGAGVVAVPPVVADTDAGVLVAGAVQGTLEMAARCERSIIVLRK